jgi:hypothetical protein
VTKPSETDTEEGLGLRDYGLGGRGKRKGGRLMLQVEHFKVGTD